MSERFKAKQVAKITGVRDWKIRDWRRRGILPEIEGRDYKIDDVIRIIASRELNCVRALKLSRALGDKLTKARKRDTLRNIWVFTGAWSSHPAFYSTSPINTSLIFPAPYIFWRVPHLREFIDAETARILGLRQ